MEPWYPRCPPIFGLVHPVRAGTDPGPTADDVRGRTWRRTSHGLHVPAGVEISVEQRVVEAAARIPGAGLVTGWAALRLSGAAYFDGHGRDVPVLLPHTSRIRAPGVEVARTRRTLPAPVTPYDIPCAPPIVALLHELRVEPVLRACVVMLEMAVLARLVTVDEVTAAVLSAPRMHAAARAAVSYVAGECRSPPEVRMGLTWQIDAGLPRPLMNREVLDLAGRRIAIVDLLDQISGCYGEYDGEMHRSRRRHRRDVERAEALREVGLESFVVVAGDSEDVQVSRMRAARRRARWASDEEREWQVGRQVPMSPLSRPLTSEEMAMLELRSNPPV